MIILPIRLGTLDFDKMVAKDNPKELSDLAKDGIYQGKYVIKEQIENDLNENGVRKFYINISRKNRRREIRFLSYFDVIKSFNERTKIFHRKENPKIINGEIGELVKFPGKNEFIELTKEEL